VGSLRARTVSRSSSSRRTVRPGLEALEDRCLLSAGALDPSFSGDGKLTAEFDGLQDTAQAVAVQPDGKIVVVGSAQTNAGAGSKDLAVIRYLPDGTPDPGFGTFGKVTIDVYNQGKDDEAFAVALQADGKILVAGYATSPGTNQKDFVVARLLNDGFLDPGFANPQGFAGKSIINLADNDIAYALAVQADGKIVVAGRAGMGGFSDFGMARLLASGKLDLSFGGGNTGMVTTAPNGVSGVNEARSIALSPDGKIVLAGYSNNQGNSINKVAVARYFASGANAGLADPAFNPNGPLPGSVVTTLPGGLANEDAKANAVVVLPNGDILTGGYLGLTFPEFAVLRYHGSGPLAGKLDSSFDGDGVAHTDIGGQLSTAEITGLALQPDGKIVAAGFGFDNNQFQVMLARYNAGGSLDTSFDGDGKVITAIGFADTRAFGMALQADGKIVVAGNTDLGNGNFAVMRFENDHLELAAPPAVGEGGTAVVTVTRVGGQTGAVSALLTVAGGSAQAGQDYAFAPQLVTFAAGQTVQTVAIPVVGDPFVEGTETLQLKLVNPAGGAGVWAADTATVNLLDVTPPPVQDVTPLVQVFRARARRIGTGTRYRQRLTLVNAGGQALAGPLALVLDGLKKGVTLDKAAGRTKGLTPVGSPYVLLDPGPGPLLPGQSRTFTIRFRSPAGKKIKYTPRVLAGVGIP
jgi:uncharacterized delta-60 repeat protein